MKSILNKNFILFFTLFFLLGFSLIILNNNKNNDTTTKNSIGIVPSSQLASSIASESINYVPLAEGFNFSTGGNTSSGAVFDLIYKWMIGIAIASSIVMVIFGGVQYMTIDSISGKSEGLSKVRGAIAGLLLAVSSYIILNTINPEIIGSNGGTPLTEDQVNQVVDNIVEGDGFYNVGDNNEPTTWQQVNQTIEDSQNPSDRTTQPTNYSPSIRFR